MTGPEHYKHGGTWLFKAEHADARGDGETAESCAAIAQAHATLALAGATALNVALSLPPASDLIVGWNEAAGIGGES